MKKKIVKLLLVVTIISSCNAQEKETLLKSSEISPKIDALVKQYQELDIFSGVVLVAEQGKPVYHKAFGLANRESGTANTLNTKFDIGSMNKTFTSMVIMQLVEEGKLKLEDKLGQYLSGFPQEAAEKITINQLLHHSSGYGDYFTREYIDAPASEKTIAALVERIKKMPLLFEPGTEQEYSNSGYIVLGAVIEKITGKSYFENVQERIITPLKLNETYIKNKRQVPEKAIGYYKNMKGELLNNSSFTEPPNPDGGFHATAMDILTFYREYHYGTQLLRRETKMKNELYRMIQEHATTGGAIPFAGGWNGANTVNYEILRDQITIIILANMDEPVAEQLGKGVLAIVRGQEPETPQLPAIQNVYQAYVKSGIDHVRTHFKKLIANFHPTDPKAIILNRIGYSFLSDNLIDEAIEVFQLNTELFPDNANIWDSLGEGYLKKGDKKKALEYYKKALALDPDMESARKMVESLE